ncbi:helix-turn-helix domain-containing protein [Lacticaseibacillus paracasei]|uniref:helix-turn-helix domain-containing protein n=1 Tax=Lacticaseibacillus paracasei TaxID=1597 RepID=UPI000C77099A|nr:helix-turn-helix domain-containing protein [Lacticaseibacillus paracasei]
MKAEIVFSEEFKSYIQSIVRQNVAEMMPQQPVPKKLNIGQAAVYAGVARNTLLSWTRKGLPMQVVGGVKRISTADIDDYMNNRGK